MNSPFGFEDRSFCNKGAQLLFPGTNFLSVAMLQKLHYAFFKSSVALVEANEGDTEAFGGTVLPWLALGHMFQTILALGRQNRDSQKLWNHPAFLTRLKQNFILKIL